MLSNYGGREQAAFEWLGEQPDYQDQPPDRYKGYVKFAQLLHCPSLCSFC